MIFVSHNTKIYFLKIKEYIYLWFFTSKLCLHNFFKDVFRLNLNLQKQFRKKFRHDFSGSENEKLDIRWDEHIRNKSVLRQINTNV